MKNSWTLSVAFEDKNVHNYFCTCSNEFKIRTMIDELEAPDILCPMCGNDYFKDVSTFEGMKSTKIWKYFSWDTIESEDEKFWKITLKYKVPIYDEADDKITFKDKLLLTINFKKDGYLTPTISSKSRIINKYSLFLDDRTQSFRKLLTEDAKVSLYKLVLSKKSLYEELLNKRNMNNITLDAKLASLRETQMLYAILDDRKEKIITKSLFQGYEESIKEIKCYPYSDYIFSKSINNIDLLIQLYKIYPAIKQHLFTKETFLVAIEFIEFLKNYYTEKQIVRFFIEDIQNSKDYQNRLLNWRDTLRMLQAQNAFDSLDNHFSKVKLTVGNLHNEIIRVFQIVTYELDAKEDFEYSKKYLSTCIMHKGLEFKLPATVQELSLWAKNLHNCVFGYTKTIHQGRSIIYGVFKDEDLLYAIELRNSKIVQAKSNFNRLIPSSDMNTIEDWHHNQHMLNG